MKSKYKTGILIIAFLFANLMAVSQDFAPWPVPDEAAAVENPVPANKASLEAGKKLYDLQCKSCHGDEGKGDGLIKSASLVSEEFKQQSDGAIFYKLQEGRGQMPSFAALPDEQLWNVINYMRTLEKMREGLVKKNAQIELFFNEKGEYREATARVMQVSDTTEPQPAGNLRIEFFVQRYFGDLPVSNNESHYTDESGEVTVQFPNDIIGDENGDLIVIARTDDMDFNQAEAAEVITWGLHNPKNYWTERRSLWKNNEYVPVWLIITFFGGALTVWAVIIYVALLIRKIKLEGDRVLKEEA